MTVSTTDNTVVYRGNGAATAFAVPFKVLDVDHLVVRRRVYATGAFEYTYIGTDYEYSGLGDSAGTLTLDGTALDDDYELVIERIVPYTQDLDIVNAGGFYPETVEEQLDLIVMAIQQLADLTGRSLRLSPGETADDLASVRTGGKVLGFNEITGDPELLDSTDFKGDPGGNIESIGLFTGASGLVIPVGTDRVRTSGFSTVGVGAADYVYDAAVTSITVAANPLTQFLAADDRGFKLSTQQDVTAYMFGAIDGTDVHDAVEAWSLFVATFRCRAASCTVDGTTSQTITLFASGFHSRTLNIHFGPKIRATATMDDLIVMRSLEYATVDWSGGELRGANSTSASEPLANRLVTNAIRFQNVPRAEFRGVLTVFNFYCWAFFVDSEKVSSFANLGYVRAFNCGSCPEAAGGNRYTANWSTPVRIGTQGSLAQTTTILVDDFPTKIASAFLYQRFVKLNGYYYRVESATGTAPNITLTLSMPWLADDMMTAGSGTLEYVFGGMFATGGPDNGVIRVAGDCIRCGIGVLDQALYGAVVSFLGSTLTEIFNVIGNGPNSAQNGGQIQAGYLEGNTPQHLLSVSNTTQWRSMALMGGTGVLLSRIDEHSPRITGGGFNLNTQALAGFLIQGARGWLHFHAAGDDYYSSNDFNLSGNAPYGRPIVVFRDSPGIFLTDIDTHTNTHFGYNAMQAVVFGSGTNGAPTTITVTPPTGHTINGGAVDAAATFTGFSGPALLNAMKTIATNDWKVRVAGHRLGGTKTFDPPSVAAGGSTTTTVTVTGAAFGQNYVAAFGVSLGGLVLTAYVSAADTVTTVFSNPTAGAVDLASSTLSVRQIL